MRIAEEVIEAIRKITPDLREIGQHERWRLVNHDPQRTETDSFKPGPLLRTIFEAELANEMSEREPRVFCPLTAACESQGLGAYRQEEIQDAARELRIPEEIADEIASAADGEETCDPEVRAALLAACFS